MASYMDRRTKKIAGLSKPKKPKAKAKSTGKVLPTGYKVPSSLLKPSKRNVRAGLAMTTPLPTQGEIFDLVDAAGRMKPEDYASTEWGGGLRVVDSSYTDFNDAINKLQGIKGRLKK